MATILAHIRVEPGRERDFESIAGELFKESHEKDVGLRHYQYWRGADSGLYYCLLAFDDFRAFLAHQTSSHHESASPRLGDCVQDLRLEWVDPVPGASDLPPTAMQPLQDDADDLTRRYHTLFRAKIQEWWSLGG